MLKRLELYFVIILSLTLHTLYAQDNYIINVQQFGLEEGLTHRYVNDVFKDSNGFLWIATQYSLQRYDGYEFKAFPLLNQKGKFVSFMKIRETNDGWLYVFTTEKATQLETIIFLNPLTGESLSVVEKLGEDLSKELGSLLNSKKYYIGDDSNQIYFVDWDEIVLFHFEKGIQKIKLPSSISEGSNTNYSLRIHFKDKQGDYWLRSEKPYRLTRFNPTKNTLELIRNPSTIKQEVSKWKGGIYVFDTEYPQDIPNNQRATLSKYHAPGKLEKLFEIPKELKAHKFVDGKLWCLGKSGWKIFDTSGTLLFDLKKKDYGIELFGDMSYKNIISDKSGKFYLNSQFGFNIIEAKKSPFIQYFSKKDDNTLPFNNAVRGIHVQNDSILINAEFGGLVLLNKKEPEEYKVISTISLKGYLERGYNGKTILRDRKGQYRVSHDAMYLQSIWSSDLAREEKVKDNVRDRDDFNPSWATWEDDNNCIWSGYVYGLKRICENDSIQENLSYKDIGIEFPELNIYHFLEAGNGKVWLSSEKGLYLFDIENEKILQHYHTKGEGEYHLPSDDIFHMHIDKDGNYWLGTRSGLVFWNSQTNEKKLFDRSDGLSNEVIYAIYEDNHNKLWLSSDYGIMSLDKGTFNVQTYLPKDGVAQKEFNRISHFQTIDGRIYFGGLNGVTSFHPDSLLSTEYNDSKVLLSECIIFDGNEDGEVDMMKTIIEAQTLTFKPNDRYFKLKFTLPTLGDVHKTLYAWKIDGVYDNWTYQKENTLQFGALPYGNHTLRIKGQGSSGGWSPQELQIQIHVLKPFYFQAWFMGLVAVATLGSIFLFFQSRTRRLRKSKELLEKEITRATAQIEEDKKLIEGQAEELKQLDKVKSRFFANVSHELRTPLTLMLGPISSVLKRKLVDNKDYEFLKIAQDNGKDLLKLIGSILDLSKMDSSKIELHEEPEMLFNLIRRIISSFESHAQAEGIRFAFNYEAEKELRLMLDKGKLEVILNNLLSNALKFTQKGAEVSVDVKDLENKIQIEVKDTGRGIHTNDLPHIFDRFYQSRLPDAPTEGGTGIGLALSQEFAKLMSGKIWVESEFGKGSTFFFSFPRKEILGMVTSDELSQYEDEWSKAGTHQEQIETKKQINLSNNAVIENLSKILVVEDNHALRSYLKNILEVHYQVITASNGLNALDELKTHPDCQLILSDLMMPEMDGFQLLRILKSKDYYRNIPVVMLTAKADIKDKLKALRVGVDDYLLKPFEEEEVLARIENLLQNYQERNLAQAQDKPEMETIDTPIISQEDMEWLENLEKKLQENISNSNYSITKLAYDMTLSERQLRRRIKSFTGLTPIQYFKEIRLVKARHLLEENKYKTVAQTAYAIGFQNTSAFSRSFLQRFGKSPSSYLMD